MKTETAIIRLAQIKARHDSRGNCKIVVRVQYKGRKEFYTTVAVPVQMWDDKTERVKAKYPNATTINAYLEDLKQRVVNAKMEYERTDIPYTAQMLINVLKVSCQQTKKFESLSVKSLIAEIVDYKQLKHNTEKNYRLALQKIVEAYQQMYLRKSVDEDAILITELDEHFCRCFAKSMNDAGNKASTIHLMMSKISALWKFAIERHGLSSDAFPFRAFKYWEEYRASFPKKSIFQNCISVMEGYWQELCLIIDYLDPFNFEYKPTAYERLQRRHTKEFALTAYLLGYHFQGLSFRDLATLRSDQIVLAKTKQGDEYYKITGVKRAKTDEPVPIVVERNPMTAALIEIYLQTANRRDGFFLPICQNAMGEYNYDTEKKLSTAMVSVESVLNRKLREVCGDINAKYNEERIPSNISYYSSRHSFATHYMQGVGAKAENLATMMGRSVSGIFNYVRELTEDDDILAERKKIYNDYSFGDEHPTT